MLAVVYTPFILYNRHVLGCEIRRGGLKGNDQHDPGRNYHRVHHSRSPMFCMQYTILSNNIIVCEWSSALLS